MKASVTGSCIGCNLCVELCPSIFKMGDEGKAEVIADPVPDDSLGCCKDAAEQCPVEAILVDQG